LEEELSIDFEDENYLNIGIKDIRYFDTDSQGNIFALEAYLNTDDIIYKFDQAGNF
jgi:hypothetical protein